MALLNKYVNDTKIWQIENPKYDDPRSSEDRSRVIKTLLESLVVVAYFTSPIMPETSRNIFDFLEMPNNVLACLPRFGNSLVGGTKIEKKDTLLFSIIDVESFEHKRTNIINKRTK